MSHPTNGDESGNQPGGNRQGGSLGQGWDSHDDVADAPFDAQRDETQVIASAQTDDGRQYDSPQGNWQDVSHDAPAQGSEAADVAGSANSSQGYDNEDFASEEPSYAQQREAEPGAYSQRNQPGRQSQPNNQGQQGWSQPANQGGQNQGGQNQGGYGQQSAAQPNQQAGQNQGGWGQPASGQNPQNPQGDPQGDRPPSAASQAASQAQAQVGKVVGGAGDGLVALVSDLQFKKSLTGRIASLTFLVTLVWAVLNFLSNLVYNFGSQTSGNISIKHMSTGSALMHTLTDLVLLVLFVGIARILLELAVNVARIANRAKD